MNNSACLFLFLISFLTSSPALAGSFFSGTDLTDLRVIQIDKENGVAVISDKVGNKETTAMGDRISAIDHEVIAIERAYIKVKADNTITRMPLRNITSNSSNVRVLREAHWE
jgi:hypothetical protein